MGAETTAFEYAMGLFSVLIGLAVADMATSFHRLMRRKQLVRWDPLTLAAALYVMCVAVYMWFDIWGVRHFAVTRHFLFYVGLVAQLFLLFLVAAACLPDEFDHSIDLRTYYEGNRRYFWSLVAVFQLVYVAFGIYFVAGDIRALPPLIGALLFAGMCTPLVVSMALVVFKSRVVHYVGIGLLFGVILFHYAPAQIN